MECITCLEGLIPVERHGVDGICMTGDDVDGDPPGNVPDNDGVVIAGTDQDVFCSWVPL